LTPTQLRYGGGILSVVEVVAGVALLVGFRARAAALALLGVVGLYVALDMVRAGGLLNRSAAFDFSVHAILLICVAIAGPGPIALDGWRGSRVDRLSWRARWVSQH